MPLACGERRLAPGRRERVRGCRRLCSTVDIPSPSPFGLASRLPPRSPLPASGERRGALACRSFVHLSGDMHPIGGGIRLAARNRRRFLGRSNQVSSQLRHGPSILSHPFPPKGTRACPPTPSLPSRPIS